MAGAFQECLRKWCTSVVLWCIYW